MSKSDEGLAVLTRELDVRVINVSVGGCLVESASRLDVGLIGTLWLQFGHEKYRDDVEVVRCQRIKGAGAAYRIGMRFLWTTPRLDRSIRSMIRRYAVDLDDLATSGSVM